MHRTVLDRLSDRCSPRVRQRELGHGDVFLAGADQVPRFRHHEVVLLYQVNIFWGRDGYDGVAPHSSVGKVACKAFARVSVPFGSMRILCGAALRNLTFALDGRIDEGYDGAGPAQAPLEQVDLAVLRVIYHEVDLVVGQTQHQSLALPRGRVLPERLGLGFDVQRAGVCVREAT